MTYDNKTKISSLYLISILLFMLVLPVTSIVIERPTHNYSTAIWPLIGKWFVFWSVGIRLFIAGLRQVTKPAFTAREIFHIDSVESFVIIKELGFANLSIGLTGILSLFKTEWTPPAAIAGGLFFGLAGSLHIQKRPESRNEMIAMISDLYIFSILLLYLIFTLS
jgi:uncharacterized protein DUF6790